LAAAAKEEAAKEEAARLARESAASEKTPTKAPTTDELASTRPSDKIPREPDEKAAGGKKTSLRTSAATSTDPCPTRQKVGKIEPGTRVVFVTSPDPGSSGAEVLLDGKCLAKIAKEAPNREIYSAMLVNISAGTYEVTIRKNGYTDVHKEVTVSASDRPVEQTPKIVVPFSMQPH
jgi:hypothetical protein